MKKKILIILPIFIFALIILVKTPTYATTYDRDYVEYTLPNQYEVVNNEEYPGDFYTQYHYVSQSGYYNEASMSCGQWSEGFTPPTEEDIQWQKESVGYSYQGSEDVVTLNDDVTGEMIEVNGVPGYKVTYTTTENSGQVFSHGIFVLISDYSSCWFSVQGPDNYVFTKEVEDMVNSIKIKDTVLKSKGIPFTDVSKTSWYFSAVKDMYDNNIISGLNKYTFGPNEKLTRGMIVTILWRMEGSPANDGKSRFTDVDSKAWYGQAVKWASANKIVNGYSGTTKFGPKDNILRQDLAGVLRNYAKYKGKNVNVTADLTEFKDYKQISNYAKASMEWAVGKKVITGNSKTKTLAPKGNATRAEAASMIKKYRDNIGL
ncbi:MAG: S-layer homology domain-containing protein [Clostridia bacterium]|nr:S-layer homology domain-containing protein [Clostridia bacterium]